MAWNFWLFIVGMVVVVGLYAVVRQIDKNHHQRKLDLLRKRQQQSSDDQ